MPSISRVVRIAVALAVLLIVLTLGVVVAQGEQLGGKVRTGSDVTIPASETVDHDLYIFGGTLTSNGTINGDLVAAGGNIDVNGPVNGDVLAAGGRIALNGPVSGDVRAAGGDVSIGGQVSKDVLATAGQVSIGGSVGQDLIVAGGQLNLTGSVAGGATGSVGTFTKTGSVAGTDSITVTGTQPSGFTPPPSNPVLDAIRQFIAVMLLAILLLWLVPRALGAAEAYVRLRPLPALGWGVVALIAYFVLVIVAVIAVIILAVILGFLGFGALLGIDLFGGFLAVSGITLAYIVAIAFVADAIVGLALARVFADRSGRAPLSGGAAMVAGPDRWSELGLLAAGVAVVVILTSLPVIGPWAKLIVVLLGLGALWLAWRRREVGPTPSAPPAG